MWLSLHRLVDGAHAPGGDQAVDGIATDLASHEAVGRRRDRARVRVCPEWRRTQEIAGPQVRIQQRLHLTAQILVVAALLTHEGFSLRGVARQCRLEHGGGSIVVSRQD
jgi:hypothetical protein